jgi:hypothetical protein
MVRNHGRGNREHSCCSLFASHTYVHGPERLPATGTQTGSSGLGGGGPHLHSRPSTSAQSVRSAPTLHTRPAASHSHPGAPAHFVSSTDSMMHRLTVLSSAGLHATANKGALPARFAETPGLGPGFAVLTSAAGFAEPMPKGGRSGRAEAGPEKTSAEAAPTKKRDTRIEDSTVFLFWKSSKKFKFTGKFGTFYIQNTVLSALHF